MIVIYQLKYTTKQNGHTPDFIVVSNEDEEGDNERWPVACGRLNHPHDVNATTKKFVCGGGGVWVNQI